MRRSCRARP